MTVLRPSLPPLISMTTSTVSLPPRRTSPGAAALAVLAMSPGTTGPTARRDDACRERVRKSRRFNMGYLRFMDGVERGERGQLRQLRLRHAEDGVDRLARPPLQGGAGRLAL